MTTVTVDHIASTAARCGLSRNVRIGSFVTPEEGCCVVVRAIEDKHVYNQIEAADGTFKTVQQDDLIVGVLGERMALRGYSGCMPKAIDVGDVLHVLNLGGIVGRCTSDHPDLGPALKVEVMGAVLKNGTDRECVRIQDAALPDKETLTESAPLIIVSGTAMNTGKTLAACEIVRGLSESGFSVAAAKVTGAALLRDVNNMHRAGAVACATFSDVGVVSSTNKRMAAYAKGLLHHLNELGPDVIVVEMGDGLLGYYGVDELLLDKEIEAFTCAHVVAATDLVGAWAADHLFHERYDAEVTVFTGPVTDNGVGKEYIGSMLGKPAFNAMREAEGLTALLVDRVRSAQTPAQVTATVPARAC